MKNLLALVLLASALQFCSSTPLTCSEGNNSTAAHLVTHHINQHHRHGYKFKIDKVTGVELEQVDRGCNMELQLDLKETKCPTIDPKDFEECPERSQGERAVVANCTVMVAVKDNNATVTKYDCLTRQEMSDSEMMRICPDCPKMIALSDPDGYSSVVAAVRKFNLELSDQESYYNLQEVGRITVGYISSTGMNYFSEFTLVETQCPRMTKIRLEACKPLCPDRARHAFCRASSSRIGVYSVVCTFYQPKNTTALGPGEQEPVCGPPPRVGPPAPPLHAHGQGPPPHAHGQGPPPHARGQGPPSHAHGQGPPPHAHGQGPPPHAHGQGPPPHAHGQGPPFPSPQDIRCILQLPGADPALHPICPFPLPLLPQPRQN